MTVSLFPAGQRNPLLPNAIKAKNQPFVAFGLSAKAQPLFGAALSHDTLQLGHSSGARAKAAASSPSSALLFKGRVGQDEQGDFYETDQGAKLTLYYDSEGENPHYFPTRWHAEQGKGIRVQPHEDRLNITGAFRLEPAPVEGMVGRDDKGLFFLHKGVKREVCFDKYDMPYFYPDKNAKTGITITRENDPYNKTGAFPVSKRAPKEAEGHGGAMVLAGSSAPQQAEPSPFFYKNTKNGPELWYRRDKNSRPYRVKTDKSDLWIERRVDGHKKLFSVLNIYNQNPPPKPLDIPGAEDSTDGDSDAFDKAGEYVSKQVTGTFDKTAGTAIGTIIGNQVGRLSENFMPTNDLKHTHFVDLDYQPLGDDEERPLDRDIEINDGQGKYPRLTRPLIRPGVPDEILRGWESTSEPGVAPPSAHGDYTKPIQKRTTKHLVNPQTGATRTAGTKERVGTVDYSKHTDYEAGYEKVVGGISKLWKGGSSRSRRRRDEGSDYDD